MRGLGGAAMRPSPTHLRIHQGCYYEKVSHSFGGSDELAIRFPSLPRLTLNPLGYSCSLELAPQ